MTNRNLFELECKRKRIHKKKENIFDFIRKRGTVVISENKLIKSEYCFSDGRGNINVVVSVSSKKGCSVWRNRFKRLVLESIRAEKNLLDNIVKVQDADLTIAFSAFNINQDICKKLTLHDIKLSVTDILKKITAQIPSKHNS